MRFFSYQPFIFDSSTLKRGFLQSGMPSIECPGDKTRENSIVLVVTFIA